MTTDNFCFYLQNRLIQTSQIRGQRYSDNSPFSIPDQSYIFTRQEENRTGNRNMGLFLRFDLSEAIFKIS
jgi:hypothetical protein